MNTGNTASVFALDLKTLQEGYRTRAFTPEDVVRESLKRIASFTGEGEWTCLVAEDEVLQRAKMLLQADVSLPFYGLPFSVKDNIDVEGLPTTAGCRAYSYTARETASVVQQLLDGGAILMGKNTMDEFATGVVGVRSFPHPCNPFNSDYIPGGSSSGSGVVVSKGCVSFSLGSDTGGSGRVPAGLCNIVGFKAAPGCLGNHGMVYANESIDCIPIFCRYVYDAEYLFAHLCVQTSHSMQPQLMPGTRIAIPASTGLQFFGDTRSQQCFNNILAKLEGYGCQITDIDFEPFAQAGEMLFEGAFVSERYHSVGHFIDQHPAEVNATVRDIIGRGKSVTTDAVWRDLHKLRRLKERVHRTLGNVDFLLTPTAPTHYTIAEVNAEPVTRNKNMAYYTNFSNLLDLAVIAVPGDFRNDGLPFGISFTTTGHQETRLLEFARMWEDLNGIAPGCTTHT